MTGPLRAAPQSSSPPFTSLLSILWSSCSHFFPVLLLLPPNYSSFLLPFAKSLGPILFLSFFESPVPLRRMVPFLWFLYKRRIDLLLFLPKHLYGPTQIDATSPPKGCFPPSCPRNRQRFFTVLHLFPLLSKELSFPFPLAFRSSPNQAFFEQDKSLGPPP